MCAAAFFGYIVAPPLLRPYASNDALLTRTLVAVAFSVGAMSISALADSVQRRRWMHRARYAAELARLRTKLFDLLPEAFARRMLLLSAPPPCERRRAAVLQLDVVGFTAMSAALPPMEVAATMHSLFSAFDAVVRDYGLFKMDTVGDAYICAGFFPGMDDYEMESDADLNSVTSSDGGSAALVCAGLLAASKAMLQVVETTQWSKTSPAACRIGISAGSIVAGGLGKLQPRFHVFGSALLDAEHCEQSGRAGAVHATAEFMRILCGGCRQGTLNNPTLPSLPGSRSYRSLWMRISPAVNQRYMGNHVSSSVADSNFAESSGRAQLDSPRNSELTRGKYMLGLTRMSFKFRVNRDNDKRIGARCYDCSTNWTRLGFEERLAAIMSHWEIQHSSLPPATGQGSQGTVSQLTGNVSGHDISPLVAGLDQGNILLFPRTLEESRVEEEGYSL